tara:strand:- start:1094 stop:1540 length:447 start_codon:yes stop_codon:yes gene_type:complete
MKNYIELISYIKKEIVTEKSYLNFTQLKPHEHILNDRLLGLENYIKSLHPYIILPSIIVCSESNTIIDGHHRYYALKKMNINHAPITKINYNSDLIVTDLENSISKKTIISSAIKNSLLKPKSTAHHIKFKNNFLPLILLSDLRLVLK